MKLSTILWATIALGLVCLGAGTVAAQNYTMVVATSIQTAGSPAPPALLATGNLCFQATDQNNNPINFTAGGGGQVVVGQVCALVVNGVSSPLSIANPVNTIPANILYRITVTDSFLTQLYICKGVVLGGVSFNFDTFNCPTTPIPAPGGVIQGPITINGVITVNGCIGCSGGGFTAGGDLSGTSSLQQVIGMLGHALPTLSTGFLNWNGVGWSFSSSGGGVSSVGLVGTPNEVTVTGTSPITGIGSWTLSLPSLLKIPGTVTSFNGTPAFGLGVPAIFGVSNILGQSSSQAATNIISSTAAAGTYRISYYIDQNATCSTGSNMVQLTFNWTDGSASRYAQSAQLVLGSAQSPNYGSLQGIIPIFASLASAVTYSSTIVGTCISGGPSSYDVHVSAEEIQ
jgi:hypothetical protein